MFIAIDVIAWKKGAARVERVGHRASNRIVSKSMRARVILLGVLWT